MCRWILVCMYKLDHEEEWAMSMHVTLSPFTSVAEVKYGKNWKRE